LSIHKEALAEAKQLREVAEKNAKNAIVQSITPRVKELIEKQLLGEAKNDDDEDDEKNVLQDAVEEIERDALDAAGEDPGLSLPDEEGKVTLDIDALKADEPEITVQSDDGEEIELTTESLKALANLVGAESENIGLKVLNLTEKLAAIRKDKKLLRESVAYTEKIKQLKTEVEAIYASLQENKKVPKETRKLLEGRLEAIYAVVNHMYVPAELSLAEKSFVRLGKKAIGVGRIFNEARKVPSLNKETRVSFVKTGRGLLKEVLKLNDIITELRKIEDSDKVKSISNNISRLYKEIRKMPRSVLSEQDFTLMIKGLPEETDVEDLDVEVVPPEGGGEEVVGAEGGEEELDLSDVGGEEDEGGGEELDLDIGDEDEEEEELGEADAQIDIDLPLDDEIEDELDISGIEADISPAEEEGDEELDLGGGEEELDLGDEEEDMDIEEIVAEIEGMNDVDECSMNSKKKNEGEEMFEISEAMLRRELKRMQSRRLNEEVSDQMIDPKASNFGGGTATKEPFRDMTDADITTENKKLKMKLQKEARMNRALKKQLETYKAYASKLKKKLAEHALFNEKIVHANKLLQNENLTPKMRMKIIKALDGAVSLKEVRRTYGTLVKALEKGKNKNLSEGTSKAGSSSSVTTSGAPSKTVLNESAELEKQRWSLLAGLSEDK